MSIRSFLSVCALLGIALAAIAQQGGGPAAKAFTGARLIDGTGKVIDNATIVVRDGRIVAAGPAASVTIPNNAQRTDLSGKTVMPGMINGHGHVTAPDHLGLYARYGVTAVLSLGDEGDQVLAMRKGQDTTTLNRARLYAAGPIVTSTDPAEARQRVAALAAIPADWVKIRVDDNLGSSRKMAPEVYQAVIDEAHKRNLRVASHLFYLDDAKKLLQAGSDFIAHSVRDKEVDAELIDLLKKRNVCVCPTLMREVSTFVYESTPAFFTDQFFLREAPKAEIARLSEPARQQQMRTSTSAQRYKVALEVAKKNLKKLSDAGIRIAMGTDTGPAGRFQGYFEHLELEQMVDAGLTPMQAIVSATGDAATCLKLNGQVGTLTPGAWADFLVLDKNPLENIKNTQTLQSVWIAGSKL